MTAAEYLTHALRTANPGDDREGWINYLQLGLGSEAGEVAGLRKKKMRHGATVTDEMVADELGDVLWYLVIMSHALGFPLPEAWPGFGVPDATRPSGPEPTITLVHLCSNFSFNRGRWSRDEALRQLSLCAKYAGFTLSDIAERNIAKLRARYPDGFKPRGDAAIAKAD